MHGQSNQRSRLDMTISLLSLHVGKIESFGPRGEPSAIGKRAVAGPLWVTRLGLVGDEQADRRHHGGQDKALHHYPQEHYARWRQELPGKAALFTAGGFGENLSTRDLCEAEACLGDIYKLGSAAIQISQGRKPCWKLNTRFGLDEMAARVHASGRTGWYYRVVEEGEAGPGDVLVLLERPLPEWSIQRLYSVLQQQANPDPDDLAFLAGAELLASGWREQAAKRLGP
jgi:MOSC domain-containing protein YiiM